MEHKPFWKVRSENATRLNLHRTKLRELINKAKELKLDRQEIIVYVKQADPEIPESLVIKTVSKLKK